MRRKETKRSLKGRINKMVSTLHFYSLSLMLIALIISLGVLLHFFSGIISTSAANHISFQLKNELSGRVTTDYTELTPEYIDIFKAIGMPYIVNPNDQQKLELEKPPELRINSKSEKYPKVDFKMSDNKLLLVQYKIFKGDKQIYDSQSPDNNIGVQSTSPKDNWLMNLLNKTSTSSVTDNNNKTLFKLEVRLNPIIIFVGYICLIFICFVIFVIALFISKIIARMSTNIIISPLLDLDKKMSELANGNIEAAFNTKITFKKPVMEVESLAGYTNIIMSRMNEYVGTLATQNEELEAQNITLQENSRSLEIINNTLDYKNTKLKNILNNVEQGFLTFSKELSIHSEYSLECETLFNSTISGQRLSSLLFSDNLNMQTFMDDLLTKIFECEKSQRKLYFPLLPEEATVNNKVIKILYKVVKDENYEDTIMVIIRDITEKRLLEKQMAEESSTLKMVVKTIINGDEFRDLVKEYEDFTNQNFSLISQEKHEKILRQIHTFKGNFSQFEMVNLVDKLNELENKLYEKKDFFNVCTIDNIELHSWLTKDLGTIEAYAGKDFITESEFCYIKKEKLYQIEKKIQETLSPSECRVILPLVKSLRYKSLKDLLKTYPDYVMKLSERLGKSITPVNITGDEIMLDANYYQDVIKSLVHIFRNAVDHGIETEDERLEKDKDQIGNIACQVLDLDNKFRIKISDDGRGIDLKALEETALIEGIYTQEELNSMDNKQKYNFIFEQGITTREKANYISGRGVGMSAVKKCIEELNGLIEVESELDKGTVFTLTLPKFEDNEDILVDVEDFMKELMETSREIILSQTGLEFEAKTVELKNMITLNKITALLSLKGTFNSIIMISVNECMANRLVKGFMIENIEENDIINYVEDVLGEISNTVLGHAFGKFEDTNNIFHIGIPAVLSNSDAYIKYTQSQILTCTLVHNEFEFSINMLLVEDDVNISDLEEEI